MTAGTRLPSRIAMRLATPAVAVLLATGCSTSPARTPETTTTMSSSAKETMNSDPIDVLALAGLTLPRGAQEVTVEDQEVPGYHFAYTVTFSASRADVDEFVRTAAGAGTSDLAVMPAGSAGPLLRDTSITEVPEGSRFAATSFDVRGGYGNLTILVDGPELTTVHVGVAAFPS